MPTDSAQAPAPIPRLHVLERTGSTNTDLADLATADPPAWPHLSVLLARTQTAGQGRAGRVWESESFAALTFSVLVRPQIGRELWGWIPLLAGLATVRALRSHIGGSGADDGGGHDGGGGRSVGGTATERIALKWPNDVVDVTGGTEDLPGWGRMRKLGGVLTEVLPTGDGAVVGIGLNLAGADLPVPWAGTVDQAGVRAGTGVAAAGAAGADEVGAAGPAGAAAAGAAGAAGADGAADPGPAADADTAAGAAGGADPDRAADAAADAGGGAGLSLDLLHAIVGEFAALVQRLENDEPVRHLVEQACVSIGARVQVDLPDGSSLSGTATALAPDGALMVGTAQGEQIIRAGDIQHLRSDAETP